MARAKKTAPPSTPAPVRHRPKIERGADAVGKTYRLTCPCGTRGDEHAARHLAEWDLNEHVAGLPKVPAGQQCRDSKRHDRRAWESCRLCEHQVALFEVAR
ncbi:hypothetical protein ABZU32_39140 [Sphaerisporangium sp. NPDC005288]|uniref:hypothetical protein n=1 Tax=Sphaerisporangium sp. NPDC005288 TaxID=3155114 RepID=UPI0033B807E2